MRENVEAWLLFLFVGLLALAVKACLTPAYADSPDPVVRLAEVAHEWQPSWRGDATPVAEAVVMGCSSIPWPDADRCESLVLAVSFRESCWRPHVIGDHPYRSVGLMQLHGAALGRSTREQARDQRTNVWLGLRWLHESGLACVRWSDRLEWVERSLSKYAGLGCEPSQTSRLALRWAGEIDRIRSGR